jgi:hypothetical protein
MFFARRSGWLKNRGREYVFGPRGAGPSLHVGGPHPKSIGARGLRRLAEPGMVVKFSLAACLALPRPVRTWTLTTLREKLIKIGAKVVRHAKAVTFQMAEVAVPRALFAAILGRIGRLRATPSPG